MATRRHALALGAAVVITPAAVAAQASAATITVNKRCYVSGHTQAAMTVTGSGFVPGDSVTLSSSDGSVVGTGLVGATGTISITTGAPVPAKLFKAAKPRTVTVTATDFSATGTVEASTTATAAPVAVSARPHLAPFTRPRTFMFSGFTPGKPIYAHYLHPKPVALQRFGKAKGPCGVLKTKALLYPGGHPRFKTYKVQFDDAKGYSAHASPRIDTKLTTKVI